MVRVRADWGKLALLLLEIDKSDSWRPAYRSLTAFIRAAAQAMDVQESVLWRLLGAARYYVSLGPAYDSLALPPLVEAAKSAGPEQLELIEKIARVAPRRVVGELLSRALSGDLPRDQIRRAWQLYRPATEGNTARGAALRGQIAARRARSPSRDLVGRGSALFALIQASAEWTGVKNASSYKTFGDPLLPPYPNGAGRALPDILAVVRPAGESDCQFHFVDFVGKHLAQPGRVLASRYDDWLPFADFIWVLSESDSKEIAIGLPAYVGILQFRGKTAHVVRPATHDPRSGRRTGETAKLLVCTSL